MGSTARPPPQQLLVPSHPDRRTDMSRTMKAAMALLLIAAVAGLTGCKPVAYYLAEVYKVYGKVTVANADPTIPLESVEVFVGDYQYSELTNSLGDYEMELPEGTWTIKFLKEGAETFTAAPITVGKDNPRQRLDAALVCSVFDLTGWWDLFVGGERVSYWPLYGRHVIIEGKIVIDMNGQRGTLTIDGPDEMHTETQWEGGSYVTMVLKRTSPPQFGRLDLTFVQTDDGEVEVYELHTDQGFGDIEGPILYYDEKVVMRIWEGVPDADGDYLYTGPGCAGSLTLRGHGADAIEEALPSSGTTRMTRYTNPHGDICIRGSYEAVTYEFDDDVIVLDGTFDVPLTTDAAI
jgi:hypothetical protein